MFGSGEITYHPVYTENLNDAFELAMEKDEAVGQTYLVADEKYYSLNDLVKMVGEAMGVKVKILHFPFTPLLVVSYLCEWICTLIRVTPPLFRRRADWYRENRGFSIEKARKELGYNPKVSLEEGLRITGEWYKENGYL
jgi:nucleoside-diphosphate-sugar epimerase